MELMVVVLIIGILIALALPTFLGASARASERSAQAQLRSAFTTARVHLAQATDYATLTPATMSALEPSQRFNAGAAVIGEISVRDVSPTTVMLISASSNGGFFCITDDTTSATVTKGRSLTDSFTVVADCTGGW